MRDKVIKKALDCMSDDALRKLIDASDVQIDEGHTHEMLVKKCFEMGKRPVVTNGERPSETSDVKSTVKRLLKANPSDDVQ